MIDQILQWDTELFLSLNTWGISALDPFFLAISKVTIWIPLYAFFIFFIFKKFDTKNALIIVAGAIVVTILTDQLSVHLFKNVFERLRPCWNEAIEGQMRLVKDGCGGKFGFVSSHATNTFGFALYMGMVFKDRVNWVLPTLTIWALFISYSRVYLGVHYPLDVICGGILGSAIGITIFNLMKKRITGISEVHG